MKRRKTDSMKRTGLLILSGLATIAIVMADGTGSNAGLRRTQSAAAVKGGAETGLLGVKLYDTAIDVIRRFGNPDEVQDVSGGTGGAVGPAGGGGAAGGAAGNARGGGGRGGGNSGSSAQAEINIPPVLPDWGTIEIFQGAPTAAGAGGAPTAAGAGQGGAPAAAGAGGGPGGTGGGAAAGQNTRVVYTRWVYKRGNSRYAFIMNRYGQVIQIEAIGANDSRVVTNKGIRYGAKFADIIKKYGVPDAYEINGNSLVLRYLVKNKVAFRLNRLKDDAPHVVTGVVVAAGKA